MPDLLLRPSQQLRSQANVALEKKEVKSARPTTSPLEKFHSASDVTKEGVKEMRTLFEKKLIPLNAVQRLSRTEPLPIVEKIVFECKIESQKDVNADESFVKVEVDLNGLNDEERSELIPFEGGDAVREQPSDTRILDSESAGIEIEAREFERDTEIEFETDNETRRIELKLKESLEMERLFLELDDFEKENAKENDRFENEIKLLGLMISDKVSDHRQKTEPVNDEGDYRDLNRESLGRPQERPEFSMRSAVSSVDIECEKQNEDEKLEKERIYPEIEMKQRKLLGSKKK
jgi:hypothetical protein